jgi:hypothetical protein
MKNILLILAIGLAVASCGVKSALTRPDGQSTPGNASDPSQPPAPIGR